MFRAQRVRNVDGSTSATVLGPEGVVAPVEKYLAFLDDLNRSSHTVRGYASDLALYFEFLSERGVEWPAAAMADLAAFSAYLRRTNRARPSDGVVLLREPAPMRAAASCQRALTAVMGFYDFHQDTALAAALVRSRQHRTNVRSDSSRSRRHPVGVKVPSRIKPHLSESELASVLTAPRRLRDQLLLSFMGLNGLRVGAVLGLRHSDIDLRKRELHVVPRTGNLNDARTKRSAPLTLPLHKDVGRLYVRYLDEEYGDWDSDYVFINLWNGELGRPLEYQTVRSLITRTSSATGIPFTAHVLRHTFATLLRRHGAEMEAVSELLGHSSVAITRSTYVHTTVEDLRRHWTQDNRVADD
jgi:integrase/recombinase XerD